MKKWSRQNPICTANRESPVRCSGTDGDLRGAESTQVEERPFLGLRLIPKKGQPQQKRKIVKDGQNKQTQKSSKSTAKAERPKHKRKIKIRRKNEAGHDQYGYPREPQRGSPGSRAARAIILPSTFFQTFSNNKQTSTSTLNYFYQAASAVL